MKPCFKLGDKVSLRRWYFGPDERYQTVMAEVIAVTPTDDCQSGYMVRCKISETEGITLDQNWLEEA